MNAGLLPPIGRVPTPPTPALAGLGRRKKKRKKKNKNRPPSPGPGFAWHKRLNRWVPIVQARRRPQPRPAVVRRVAPPPPPPPVFEPEPEAFTPPPPPVFEPAPEAFDAPAFEPAPLDDDAPPPMDEPAPWNPGDVADYDAAALGKLRIGKLAKKLGKGLKKVAPAALSMVPYVGGVAASLIESGGKNAGQQIRDQAAAALRAYLAQHGTPPPGYTVAADGSVVRTPPRPAPRPAAAGVPSWAWLVGGVALLAVVVNRK